MAPPRVYITDILLEATILTTDFVSGVDLPANVDFLPILFQDCGDLSITLNMTAFWEGAAPSGSEAKVRVKATIPSTFAETLVTLTLHKN